MTKKISGSKVLFFIAGSLLVLLLGITGIIGAVKRFERDPLPEGFSYSHHSYEEMQEFARAIDPNATVSEDYVDVEMNQQTIREWQATINGIDCKVMSYPETVISDNSKSLLTAYSMDTDYDHVVLEMILEDYPELGTLDEETFGHISISAEECSYKDLQSTVRFNMIDEETFDELWESYVQASQEYASYGPTRGFVICMRFANRENIYLENTGDDQYQNAVDLLFS